MSESYERYVHPATKAVLAANYSPGDGTTEALIAGDMRIALAAVGPLIAEDTRERMVAAAVEIMEREGFEDQRAQVAEEIALAIEGQLVGLLDGFQARSAAAAAAREIGARNPS